MNGVENKDNKSAPVKVFMNSFRSSLDGNELNRNAKVAFHSHFNASVKNNNKEN